MMRIRKIITIYCESSKRIATEHFNQLLQPYNLTWNKELPFTGAFVHLDLNRATYLNLEILIYAHFIFTCKIMKELHTLTGFSYHRKYYIDIFSFSKKFSRLKTKWGTCFPNC